MGLQTLPNGTEFFSLSEELQGFTQAVYASFTPLNIGIILVVSMVFIGILVFMAFYIAGKQIEALS